MVIILLFAILYIVCAVIHVRREVKLESNPVGIIIELVIALFTVMFIAIVFIVIFNVVYAKLAQVCTFWLCNFN